MADSFGPMLTRRSLLSSTALAILGAAALPLTACGGGAASDAADTAAANRAKRTFVDAVAGAHAGTATGTPWVSTNLAKNLTEDFSPAAKEDFYAVANADWLKEQKVPEATHS